MSSAAAALLDQLMGKHRNATAGEDTKREHWSDPDVCKYFLCGFCPSELFTNTRSDIGPCEKNHDETLQIAYTASSKFGRMGYEEDFLECLERVVRDLDKRIQRGKERLARSAEANKRAFDESGTMFSERLQSLSAEISDLIHQSEELGNRGDVEAAQELILRVEELEKEKERERSAMMLKANVPQTVAGFEIDPGNFHEKNEICDVCGCFLIIGDTQARMDAHLMGKQHMGFARIRSKIAELKQAREDKIVKEAEERRARRESRSTRDEETRDRRVSTGHRSRSRDREKRRSRSRDRDRRRRSRSREKKRSRSRDKRYRSRSGDWRRRSKERRRSHSRERRRSRSRDSKRRRRSRSRSHERTKHRDKKRDRSDRGKHRSRSRSKDRKDEANSKNCDAPSEEAMEGSSTNGEGAGLGQDNHITAEGPETANGIDAD